MNIDFMMGGTGPGMKPADGKGTLGRHRTRRPPGAGTALLYASQPATPC